jgi:hypothetical protein
MFGEPEYLDLWWVVMIVGFVVYSLAKDKHVHNKIKNFFKHIRSPF